MPDTIFHTDRGAEYSSGACVDACTRLGLLRARGDRLEATSLRNTWGQIDESLRAGK